MGKAVPGLIGYPPCPVTIPVTGLCSSSLKQFQAGYNHLLSLTNNGLPQGASRRNLFAGKSHRKEPLMEHRKSRLVKSLVVLMASVLLATAMVNSGVTANESTKVSASGSPTVAAQAAGLQADYP